MLGARMSSKTIPCWGSRWKVSGLQVQPAGAVMDADRAVSPRFLMGSFCSETSPTLVGGKSMRWGRSMRPALSRIWITMVASAETPLELEAANPNWSVVKERSSGGKYSTQASVPAVLVRSLSRPWLGGVRRRNVMDSDCGPRTRRGMRLGCFRST